MAAIEGDRHTLPTTMAAVALREDNWTVHHLGSDRPVAELASFCRTEPIDLMVLAVTEPAVTEATRAAASSIRALGIPVIVGGPGRTLHELLTEARSAGGKSSSRPTQPPKDALRARR
jgi:cobalamin-dependent methionine synthase I